MLSTACLFFARSWRRLKSRLKRKRERREREKGGGGILAPTFYRVFNEIPKRFPWASSEERKSKSGEEREENRVSWNVVSFGLFFSLSLFFLYHFRADNKEHKFILARWMDGWMDGWMDRSVVYIATAPPRDSCDTIRVR